MPVSLQAPRSQEKLDLILSQVAGLRSRLNSLALQQAIYLVLAISIASAAVLFATATILSPLKFLVAAAATIVAGLLSLVLAVRSAWRRRSNAALAAALADDRAGLKDRLTTIVQTAGKGSHGPLWDYLVEDALERSDDFVPWRIESRRIARSWWAPFAATAFAALLVLVARSHRTLKLASNPVPPDITVDLDDLHLRPADPDDPSGLEVDADPATMARLREKLEREGMTDDRGEGGRLGGLLDRAKNLASDVQRKLRGESKPRERLTLKLADKGATMDPRNPRGSDAWPRKSHRGDQAGQFKREDNSNDEESLPPIDESRHEPQAQPSATENADTSQDLAARDDGGSGDDQQGRQSQGDQTARGDQSTNGGLFHGIGADPDSLFGEASKSKMTAEGFEIAIEARPVERGGKGAGQAYLPPKVHTPLNPNQKPDEPIARAAVPPDDRITIQRVFER